MPTPPQPWPMGWLTGPDAAYEGSDPTGAVWVTACGRGRLRGVALFGGWRDAIGLDLGDAVMHALADACEARRQALAAASAPGPCESAAHQETTAGIAGTGPHGWVTVTVLPSGEVTGMAVAPALFAAADVHVMREVQHAFRAAYAATIPAPSAVHSG